MTWTMEKRSGVIFLEEVIEAFLTFNSKTKKLFARDGTLRSEGKVVVPGAERSEGGGEHISLFFEHFPVIERKAFDSELLCTLPDVCMCAFSF